MSPRHAAERGTTVVEVTMVVAVIAALSGVVVQSLLSLARTQRATERRAQVLAVAERTLHGMLADVDTAFRVYADDAHGRDLLGRLDAAPPREARLPVATARGVFEPDPVGVTETGNLLLVGRALEPVEVATEGAAGGESARFEVLQLVLYHLAPAGDRLELDRWASVPLVRADDVAALDDPVQRQTAIAALHARGLRLAWRAEARPDAAFFELTDVGSTARVPVGFVVPRSARDSRPGLLERRGVAVARNGEVPQARVPAFGHPGGDHPHGFELKLDGDGAGRLLLLRLALVSREGDDVVHAVVERLAPLRGTR